MSCHVSYLQKPTGDDETLELKEIQARKMEEAKYANAHDLALGVQRLVITDIGRGGQDQSVQGGGHNEGDKGQDCRYGQRSFKAAGECGVQEEVIEEEKCQDNLGG